MEDILASIKRIIAEDGEAAAPPAPIATVRAPRARRDEGVAPLPDPLGEPEDVLELTRPIDPVIARASAAAASRPAGGEGADLLSGVAADAGRNAFAALSSAVAQPGGAGNPLESMLREMLRPMLRDWLDTNLPTIVERMVAGEIARISGRR